VLGDVVMCRASTEWHDLQRALLTPDHDERVSIATLLHNAGGDGKTGGAHGGAWRKGVAPKHRVVAYVAFCLCVCVCVARHRVRVDGWAECCAKLASSATCDAACA
jgi:hypothetical protein